MSMHNEESSWLPFEPLPKKHKLFRNKATLEQKLILDYPIALPDDQQEKEAKDTNNNEQNQTNEEKKVAVVQLIKEIQDELELYRHDIYMEKAKVFEKRLESIEDGTHTQVVESDKQALRKVKSDMQQAEEQYKLLTETLERNFELQKAEIMKEYQKELDLIKRAISPKKNNVAFQQNVKRTRQQTGLNNTQDIEQNKIPRTDFQEKISRLQAIAERQKVMRINRTKHYINTLSPDEADDDLLSIKRQINAQAKN